MNVCTIDRPTDFADVLSAIKTDYTALSYSPATDQWSAMLWVGDDDVFPVTGEYDSPLAMVIRTDKLRQLARVDGRATLRYDRTYAQLSAYVDGGAVIDLDRMPMYAWANRKPKKHARPTIAAMLIDSRDSLGTPRFSIQGQTIFIRTPRRTYTVSMTDVLAELMERELDAHAGLH